MRGDTLRVTAENAEASPTWSFARLWLASFLCFGVLYAYAEPFTAMLSAQVEDAALRSLVLGLFGLTALIARPLGGALADRWQPRRVLGLGALALAVGVWAASASQAVEGLMLARVLQAIGYATFSTAGVAWATRLGGAGTRATRLARYGMAANLAMAVMPTFSHALSVVAPAGWISTLLGLAAVGAGVCAQVDDTAPTGRASAIRQPRLAVVRDVGPRVAVLALLLGLGFGVFWQYLPLKAGADAGVAYGAYGLVILATRWAAGPWLDRQGLGRVAVWSGVALTLGAATVAAGGWLQWPGVAAIAIGCGLLQPAVFAAAVRRAPESPGLATGWCYAAFDFGLALSGWALGPALSAWGPAGVFATTAGLMTLVVAVGRDRHDVSRDSLQAG